MKRSAPRSRLSVPLAGLTPRRPRPPCHACLQVCLELTVPLSAAEAWRLHRNFAFIGFSADIDRQAVSLVEETVSIDSSGNHQMRRTFKMVFKTDPVPAALRGLLKTEEIEPILREVWVAEVHDHEYSYQFTSDVAFFGDKLKVSGRQWFVPLVRPSRLRPLTHPLARRPPPSSWPSFPGRVFPASLPAAAPSGRSSLQTGGGGPFYFHGLGGLGRSSVYRCGGDLPQLVRLPASPLCPPHRATACAPTCRVPRCGQTTSPG